MLQYYPLAVNNQWHYRQKDGSTYANAVLGIDGNLVRMQNSSQPTASTVKISDGILYNELMEPGNFQPWLKDGAKSGDTWEASFKANGLDSVLLITVKATGISKEVADKTYTDVMVLEAESKIRKNGNLISTHFFTQYYYAKGTGLILTTSSMGDEHTLIHCELN